MTRASASVLLWQQKDFRLLEPVVEEKKEDKSSTQCRKCHRSINPDDVYCRHCGERQSQSAHWLYHPFTLIILAFVFIGPFAIPLVMRSPFLNKRNKMILSFTITLYTFFTLYMVYRILIPAIDQWQELREELGLTGIY